MKSRTAAVALLVAAVMFPYGSRAATRDLTFEDRVRAQEAIERVYYSHQIGATKPFEEAVSRELLQKKVRTYLKQTLALDKYWHTPVTAEMLHRELERMTRGSRMPERLRELYAVLGNDPFLIHECLARPALVDRLTRNFFAYDEGMHREERRKATALRDDLVNGALDPFSEHPNRAVLDLVRVDSEEDNRKGVQAPAFPSRPSRVPIVPDEFEKRQGMFPEGRTIGPLIEDRDEFVVRAVLERRESELRLATYVVPKRDWRDWWEGVEGTLDEGTIEALGPIEDGVSGMVRAVHGDREFNSIIVTPLKGERSSGASSSCIPDDTWENGSLDDFPDVRYGHTAVWTGSLMVIWGGVPSTSTGSRYDPATDTWTPTSTVNAPTARGSHTAVWTGSVVVIWGGTLLSNTGGRYDPATDTWTSTSTVGAPAARGSHTAVWTGSRMVVWGGVGASGELKTGGRYDPSTDTWTSTSTVGVPLNRSQHTSVWAGTTMVVWGGIKGSTVLNTGGRYVPSTDSWLPMTTVGAPPARRAHTAVWSGTEMIVWGGLDDASAAVNTGGRYDPATDVWTATSTVSVPSARTSHTAVWTGSRMIVWGGSDAGNPLSSGGRYDPATDTWTSTSSAGAPEARDRHTAVWTGSRMIVWGGYGTVAPVSSGGRYDPWTDSWTPTSLLAAPTARYNHTAAWTGSSMIVWGGTDDSSDLDTGGRYNPATDVWSATSMVSAPSPRTQHTAVWTGSQMIVWGGVFNDGQEHYLDTGGRYDPESDTWLPTSLFGAPSAREYHTAVWSGSLMVVWGGGEYPYVNTGGRYDPATDTWTPTSVSGAPTARAGHSAVWTGSVMIIWTGYDNAFVNTGGRYDPSTDSWSPTSTVGAPAGRNSHSHVWTGSLSIVWGGLYASPLRTGGMYSVTPEAPTDRPTLTIQKSGTTAMLSWSVASGATGYDVAKGSLGVLRSSGGDFTSSTTACLADDLAVTTVDDTEVPPAGSGLFYLVRAMNCGGNGSYDELEGSQQGSRDAEVDASSAACP